MSNSVKSKYEVYSSEEFSKVIDANPQKYARKWIFPLEAPIEKDYEYEELKDSSRRWLYDEIADLWIEVNNSNCSVTYCAGHPLPSNYIAVEVC